MNYCLLFAKEDMTFPNALKLAFICLASSNLAPLEVVCLTLSEPARSIRVSLPETDSVLLNATYLVWNTSMFNIV